MLIDAISDLFDLGSSLNEAVDWIIAVALIAVAVRVLIEVKRYAVQAAVNWRRGRRIHDFLFDPADFDSLPAAMTDHFTEFTDEMQWLGFEPIGDYQMLCAPWPLYSRFFLAPDRHSFGEVYCSRSGLRAYSFFSVCDDGAYLESVTTKTTIDATDQLRIWSHPDTPLRTLYATHQEHLRDHCRSRDCRPVEMTAEDLQPAAQFGRQLATAPRSALGKRLEPPEFATRASIPH